MGRKKIGIPLEGFAELCRSAAAQGAVLLKNEEETLPVTNGSGLPCSGGFRRITIGAGPGRAAR